MGSSSSSSSSSSSCSGSMGVVVYVVVVVLVVAVGGFNLEEERFILHQGTRDSEFGFSVSHHRDTSGAWILVGAPEAQTQQEDIVRGGAVFKCHPLLSNCLPIPFDLAGNHWEAGRQMENKSLQWFGAHVTSSSGVIVACAPRYVWLRPFRQEPVGRCFYTSGRDSDGYNMFSPCMESAKWGYHLQGSCQAGYSASITQNGNRLYVGAVGSYYWQGQVFFQDLLSTRENYETPESSKLFDMSYLGYSMTAGDYDGDGNDDLAVGMPRGSQLRGKVVILNHLLRPLQNISGDQLGSYFGYSLATSDVNGDGLSDIIVGAPWHSDDGNTAQYEVGGVGVFVQSAQHIFKLTTSLFGTTTRGHFGISVTTLGDLNKDGFQDIAVGAPNAGEDGSGEVYIYLGTRTGVSTEPSQILSSQLLTQGTIRTFGWSLSGGEDVDDNGYPDLILGAHSSDAALVFLTRPVVTVDSSVKFRSAKGIIDLDVKGCSLQSGEEVPCVSLLYCLSYRGYRVPPEIELDVSLSLDVLSEVNPRMFFLKLEREREFKTRVRLRKSVEECTTVYTYLEPQIHDKLTPLEAELKATLPDLELVWVPGVLKPILTPSSPQRDGERARIYVKNNCGDDNVCVPDLSLHLYRDKREHVIGSQEHISFKILVSNIGEDAFQTVLKSDIPSQVSYASFSVLRSPQDVTPICSLAGTEVLCEIGNPLPSDSEVTLRLSFQPHLNLSMEDVFFSFTIESASSEEEGGESNNKAEVSLPIVRRSLVEIKGISIPESSFEYNKTRYHELRRQRRETDQGGTSQSSERMAEILYASEIGPEVEHIYDITNRGPSSLPSSTLYLLWPSRTVQSKPLLYLVEEPNVVNAKCEATDDVNYLNIKIDRKKATRPTVKDSRVRDPDTPEEAEEVRIRHRRRRRRRRREEELQEALKKELQCGLTRCTVIKCRVRSLEANSNIVVKLRSRLWIDTIEELGMPEVSISSRCLLTTSTAAGLKFHRGVVSSVVGVDDRHSKGTSSLKWLVITASVISGLLLLALLCAVLWAMGFFKRKRPQDTAESEPLSTNGFYGK